MSTDTLRRIGVDAAVLAVGAVALAVRQPWLPPDLGSLFPGSASLLALGLVPFVTAFVLVELVAFAVPPWRRLIRGGPRERARLWWIACGLALGVAALQAFAMAVALEQVAPELSGPAFRGGVVTGFTIVTAGVAAASRLVDRYGLGGGFALFLLVGAGLAIANWTTALFRLDPLGALLPALLLSAIVGGGTLWLVRPPYRARGGLVPAALALVAGGLAPGGGWSVLATGLVWIGASVALVRVFHPPARVAAIGSPEPMLFLQRRAAVRRGLGRGFGWTLVLSGFVVVPSLLAPGPLGAVSPLLFSTALFTALAVDLADELRVRASGGTWVAAWPLHQVWLVAPALDALAAAGIPAHVRSVRYRACTGPLAPLVAMDVLVPGDRIADARRVLEAAVRIDVSAVVRDTLAHGAGGVGAVD